VRTIHILHGPLKVELQRKLHCPRISGLLDLAEGCVAKVPIGIHELRFVEQIENIRSELEVPCLGKRNSLRKSNVPLIFPWAAADRTGCG
jgi:hypothetical protein